VQVLADVMGPKLLEGVKLDVFLGHGEFLRFLEWATRL